MKLQLKHTVTEDISSHLTPEQISERVKHEITKKLAEHMMQTVILTEEPAQSPFGKTFTAEIIYMPTEQWEHVLGMFRILKLAPLTSEAINVVNQIVNEIRNK